MLAYQLAYQTSNIHPFEAYEAISRRVASRDGLVMTITTTSLSDSGERHVNVGVYLKANPVKQDVLVGSPLKQYYQHRW